MAGSHVAMPAWLPALEHMLFCVKLSRKVTSHVFYVCFQKKDKLPFLQMPYSSTLLVSDISLGATYTRDCLNFLFPSVFTQAVSEKEDGQTLGQSPKGREQSAPSKYVCKPTELLMTNHTERSQRGYTMAVISEVSATLKRP